MIKSHALFIRPIQQLVAVLLIASLAFIPVDAYAVEVAGKVIALRGTASAINAVKQSRALKRGATVYAGDRLVTTPKSRLLVRMTDNTAIAVHGDSEYQIKQYRYNQTSRDVNNGSFFKGSMRVLTGAISKENPKKFSIRTPVAVIGVRGTEFSLNYRPDPSGLLKLRVLTRRGIVLVTTNGGTATVTPGRYVDIANINEVPVSNPAPSNDICF